MNAYGVEWKTDDAVIPELRLYRDAELRQRVPGALSQFEHLTNAIRHLLPAGSGLEWHEWMDESIRHWCERDIISCWGPSSAGKSAIWGLLAYIDLLADSGGTLTVIITDRMGGHAKRAWGNVMKWRGMMPKRWQIGRAYSSTNLIKLDTTAGGQISGIFCYSTAPGDDDQDLKRKLGGHNRRNRLIVDEAQSCGMSIMDLRRNLGATGEYKEVFMGNPDAWGNPLGIHSEPLDGDHTKTADQSVTEWETTNVWNGNRGVCYVLDGRNSPAARSPAEMKRLWFLPNKETLANYRDQPGGEDSPKFWTYAVGRIPPSGGRLTALSEADAIAVGAAGGVPWADGGKHERWVGIDTSLGGDDTVLVLVEVGECFVGPPIAVQRRVVCQVQDMRHVVVNVKLPDVSGQIAAAVVRQVNDWGVPWERVAVESGGQQAHLIDTIERMASCHGKTRRVNPSGPASERVVGRNGETARDRIATRAAELVLNLGELVGRGTVRKIPDIILKQLQTRGVILGEGRTDIQDKREWRRAYGNKSPDEMDALAVVVDVLLERGRIKLGEPIQKPAARAVMPFDWMEKPARAGRAGVLARRIRQALKK